VRIIPPVSILQIGKLRPREAKELEKDHMDVTGEGVTKTEGV
jgi:hypothetical protein